MGKVALLSGRDLLHGTIRGIKETFIKTDAEIKFGVLDDQFQMMNTQFGLLKRLQEWAYPAADFDALKQMGVRLADSVREIPFDEHEARRIIKQFEDRTVRRDALIARTLAAGELLTTVAVALGIKPQKDSRGEIRRSIVFPPEMKQAAVGILSYFSHLLEKNIPTPM